MVEREDEEIDEQIRRASEQIDAGSSRYPGMTYEEGVRDALDWVTGCSNDAPFPDDDGPVP